MHLADVSLQPATYSGEEANVWLPLMLMFACHTRDGAEVNSPGIWLHWIRCGERVCTGNDAMYDIGFH